MEMKASDSLGSGHLLRITPMFHELFEYNTGARRLHLKDLNGVVHALGRVVEDEAGVGNVGVKQLILSTAEIDVAVINRTVLVDMVVERQFRFREGLSLY